MSEQTNDARDNMQNCPFCGDNDVAVTENERLYRANCTNCGVMTPLFPRRSRAVRFWNTRQAEAATEPAAGEVCESERDWREDYSHENGKYYNYPVESMRDFAIAHAQKSHSAGHRAGGSAERERVKELQKEIARISKTIDAIYSHNACRAAVIQHYGLHHSAIVRESLETGEGEA